MKRNITILLCLLSLYAGAQKPYVQAGFGFVRGEYYGESSGVAELNFGYQLSKIFYAGLGVSYLKFQGDGNSYIPVYADIKIMGNGKFRPYILVQPGYSIYRGLLIYSVDSSYNTISSGHIRGGFYSNMGVGIYYRNVYLQATHRFILYSYPGSIELFDDSEQVVGLTIGFMFL